MRVTTYSERPPFGCILFLLGLMLVFWSSVAYIVLHFLLKFW